MINFRGSGPILRRNFKPEKGRPLSSEFCEHLQQYRTFYVQAEAAYRHCNHLIDRILSEGQTSDLLDSLSLAAHDWTRENMQLRKKFKALVKSGHIVLPEAKDGAPACAECGEAIQRLVFPEWSPGPDGGMLYRGKRLQIPAQQPA
mgnify:CR=1 FL=1